MSEPEWWMSVDDEYIDTWNTVYRIKRTRGSEVQWWDCRRTEWVSERKFATTFCACHLAEAVMSTIVSKATAEKLPPFAQHIDGWGIELGGRRTFGENQ
jgi:hypothetical protein